MNVKERIIALKIVDRASKNPRAVSELGIQPIIVKQTTPTREGHIVKNRR